MSILLMINSSRMTGRDTLGIVTSSSAVLAVPLNYRSRDRLVRSQCYNIRWLFWLYLWTIDPGIAWLEASATILGDFVSFVVDIQPFAWLQKTSFCLRSIHFKHSKRMPWANQFYTAFDDSTLHVELFIFCTSPKSSNPDKYEIQNKESLRISRLTWPK